MRAIISQKLFDGVYFLSVAIIGVLFNMPCDGFRVELLLHPHRLQILVHGPHNPREHILGCRHRVHLISHILLENYLLSQY